MDATIWAGIAAIALVALIGGALARSQLLLRIGLGAFVLAIFTALLLCAARPHKECNGMGDGCVVCDITDGSALGR